MKESIEGAPQHADNEEIQLSRREFLKTIMAGGAAALVSGGCVSRERPIVFPEMERDATWELGLERLKDAVFDLDAEANAIYAESNRKGEWKYVKTEGRTTGGFRRDAIDSLIRNQPEIVTLLHTHPLEVFLDLFSASELPRAKIEEIRQTRQTEASMVPSLTDVISAINTHEYFSNTPTKLQYRVLDPSGIWSYAVDLEHPFAIACRREERNLRVAEKLLDQDASVRAVERSVPKNTQSESTRIWALWSVRERLSPAARKIVEDLEGRAREFSDRIYAEYGLDAFVRKGVDFAKHSFGGDPVSVDVERARMMDVFKTLGVDLAFERYGESAGK